MNYSALLTFQSSSTVSIGPINTYSICLHISGNCYVERQPIESETERNVLKNQPLFGRGEDIFCLTFHYHSNQTEQFPLTLV